MENWTVILFCLWIFLFLKLNVSCPVGRFGSTCQFLCHCHSPSSCEQTTGECQDDRCEGGWMGPACQYRNLVYGKQVVSTSGDPTSITDGINNGNCFATIQQYRPKVQISLGQSYKVEELRLVFPRENLMEMAGFVVRVGDVTCYQHSGPVLEVVDIQCTQAITGFYVSVSLEGHGRLSVCEVEVYQGRNVAFGKTTSQSSNYTNGFGETFPDSLAVDGDPSVNFIDLSCTHTQPEYTPWWRVDLGTLYQITEFRIYNRQEQLGRLAYFQIFLGNSTDIDSSNLLYEDSQTIPLEVTTIRLQQVEVGRYVFVQLPGQGRILTLCEVEVFGDCLESFCGLECGIPCPCNHPEVVSRKMSGICSRGCKEGWVTEENGTCSRGSCSVNEFGPDCEHECHCSKGCNPLTGVCLGGSDFCQLGWDGPFCQRENFLLNAKAKRRYFQDTFLSPMLTDGDVMSCPQQTVGSSIASYKMELTVARTITNLRIYMRDTLINNELLVYTGQGEAKLPCTTEVLERQIQVSCGGVIDRFIIVRKKNKQGETRASFQLCEVEAYECANGTFGLLCDKFCHCEDNVPCDKQSGLCTNRKCHPGWLGPTCSEKCASGFFGQDCVFECTGHCKHGSICSHIDGKCTSGCQDGWQGTHCDEACDRGRYGRNCESFCGLCKTDETCDPRTGVCPAGCAAGKRTDLCNQDCLDGDFGEDCRRHCGRCYDNLPCNKISGICSNGCQEGWQGDLCKTECRSGSFGRNCERRCGYCLENMPCDRVKGDCPSGCSAGWHELKCDKKCPDGKYGLKCAQSCGRCTDGQYCDKVGGHCTAGCEPGWRPPFCNQECEHGKYGINCRETCGHCRNGATCDKTTGVCYGGCEPGWTNDMCSAKCSAGYYGDNCRRTCSSRCKQKSCDHVIGNCSNGCEPGWTGEYCSNECEIGFYGEECLLQCFNCLDQNCSHINGSCVHGCVDGMTGHDCTQKQAITSPLKKKITATVLGIFVAVIVIVLLLVLYLCRQGRCHSLRKNKKNKKLAESDPNMSMSAIQSSQREDDYGMNNSLNISDAPTLVDPNRNMLGMSAPLQFAYDNHGYQDIESAPSFKSFSSNNTHLSPDRVSLLSDSRNVYGNVSMATSGPCGAVAVENLRETIQQKLIDPCCLPEEFMGLTSDLAYPYNEAMKPENYPKNRYKKIYPYDHNRVILLNPDSPEKSDYINASYVDGFHQRRSYVAAQGPIEATMGDFWRMIWQLDVGKIVMLTGLVEGGRIKCQQYWPDTGETVFGDVTVKIVNCDSFAEFDTRTFEIHMESCEPRTVKQFHFTSWPDMDVPEKASSMVHFWNAVRTSDTEATGPVVVHCSAGIGRTGTFLALDYLVDEARANNYVQIVGCVQNLRFQRVNMVQTEKQYRYLHEVLEEALTSSDSSILAENFVQVYQELFNQDDDEGKTKLEIEFENLQIECLPPGDEEFISAKDQRNRSKNRNSCILASDNYRPYLHTPGLDTTNYINAVFLPGYRSRNAYIVTQMPLPDTVVDLWRLVYEQGIQTIIQLNHTDIFNMETGVYWPVGEDQEEYGPFTVVVQGCEHTEHGSILTLSLTYSRVANSDPQIINLHQYNKVWQEEQPVPTSPTAFLKLLQEIRVKQVESTKTPIIVQCSDGAERSGLFCVMSSVIDRLRVEHKVDIRETVKLNRCRRREVVSTMDQYRFCHDVILEYIQTADEDTFATRF